eukprot:5156124-Amphidinium_carterae.1
MDVCDGDAADSEVDAARRELMQTELVTLRTVLAADHGAEVLPDLVMAMAAAGLRLAAAPAVAGKGDGTRAGVAVGARINFGFKFISKGQGLLEGRTCAAKIGGLVPGGLTVGSEYLLSGATSSEQLPYLTELAIWFRTFTGPFLLGVIGKWNLLIRPVALGAGLQELMQWQHALVIAVLGDALDMLAYEWNTAARAALEAMGC